MTARSEPDGLVVRPAAESELDLILSLPGKPASDVAADWSSGHRRPGWCWLAFAEGRHRPLARALWWGGPASRFPLLLDTLDVDLPDQARRRAVGTALLRAALPSLTAPGGRPPRCLLVLPPDWQDRPDARAAAEDRMAMAAGAGLRPAGRRLGFGWSAWPVGTLIPPASGRLRFQPVAEAGEDVLLRILTQVQAGTLESDARRRIGQVGPAQTAREQLAELREQFPACTAWWRLAFEPSGQPVGFVLPGRTREGLGIVGAVGVLPEHRGHRYVDDLLGECARVLAGSGADRIRADTDTENTPMIEAFHRAGYRTTYARVDLM